MNSSKVILVQPPIEDFYLTKKRTIPYGLASIAASVKKLGFDVTIIDALATKKSKTVNYPENFSYLKKFYNQKDTTLFSLFNEFRHFGYSYEHIATKVKAIKPFLVGISSLFTAYSNEALKTAIEIKRFYPQCKIVLGGHHVTQFPEETLQCSAVDLVLRGEGEVSMGLLCNALKNGTDLELIPGIAFKKKSSFFISDPLWVKDLNTIPLPAFNLINHKFYNRNNKTSSVVVSSRGCPMQCSYCSVSSLSSYAPFRQRSVENVIQEIKEQISDHNIGFIDFEDENLCLNKEWFLSLFSKIRKIIGGKNIELRAMNGLYPPAIDEDIVIMMKESGFKILNLSLGTTCKKQLEKFKRQDVISSFENALALAKKHGLESVSYLIAAAPGQIAQTSLNDLLYLAQKSTLIGLSIYYPAPGSFDYSLYENENIFPKQFNLMRSAALPLDDQTSRVQAVTLLRLSRILNFMKHLKDTNGFIPKAEPEPESGPELEPVAESEPEFRIESSSSLNLKSKTMPKYSSRQKLDPSDRQAVSLKLLQWFLNDGIIRGVNSDGQIYNHSIDLDLSLEFIKKIKTINIAGVISG